MWCGATTHTPEAGLARKAPCKAPKNLLAGSPPGSPLLPTAPPTAPVAIPAAAIPAAAAPLKTVIRSFAAPAAHHPGLLVFYARSTPLQTNNRVRPAPHAPSLPFASQCAPDVPATPSARRVRVASRCRWCFCLLNRSPRRHHRTGASTQSTGSCVAASVCGGVGGVMRCRIDVPIRSAPSVVPVPHGTVRFVRAQPSSRAAPRQAARAFSSAVRPPPPHLSFATRPPVHVVRRASWPPNQRRGPSLFCVSSTSLLSSLPPQSHRHHEYHRWPEDGDQHELEDYVLQPTGDPLYEPALRLHDGAAMRLP